MGCLPRTHHRNDISEMASPDTQIGGYGMKHAVMLPLAFLVAVRVACPAQAGHYVFTTVTHGTDSITVRRISDSGTVVGANASTNLAFLLSGDQYTAIAPAFGLDNIDVRDINSSGAVLGTFIRNNVGYYGFIREANGAFLPLQDVPAHRTVPMGLNDIGDYAGDYIVDTNGNQSRHGYSVIGGNMTLFDVPGASDTSFQDLNNKGEIVGFYLQGGRQTAFLLRGTVLSALNPAGVTYVATTGLNDRDEIVGQEFVDGAFHAFIRNPAGGMEFLDYPGAVMTLPIGINNHGRVVGTYQASGGGTLNYMAVYQYDLDDVKNVMGVAAGTVNASTIPFAARLDINGDGVIDSADAAFIARVVAGLDPMP